MKDKEWRRSGLLAREVEEMVCWQALCRKRIKRSNSGGGFGRWKRHSDEEATCGEDDKNEEKWEGKCLLAMAMVVRFPVCAACIWRGKSGSRRFLRRRMCRVMKDGDVDDDDVENREKINHLANQTRPCFWDWLFTDHDSQESLRVSRLSPVSTMLFPPRRQFSRNQSKMHASRKSENRRDADTLPCHFSWL